MHTGVRQQSQKWEMCIAGNMATHIYHYISATTQSEKEEGKGNTIVRRGRVRVVSMKYLEKKFQGL